MDVLINAQKIVQRLCLQVTQNRIYGINSFWVGILRSEFINEVTNKDDS
jgi:hypothetical protein